MWPIPAEQPNVFGCPEDVASREKLTHRAGALLVVSFDPLNLGILKRPGDWGADIAVTESRTKADIDQLAEALANSQTPT